VSGVTVKAAQDLDQWYAQHGCSGCDEMGSDLRVRALAFKAAALLDPATQNNVNLNVSTPLAQSGFGPGTDSALSLVLGAQRLSTGHCTDDAGNCTVQGMQTPAIPPELQAVANALGATIGNVIQQGQQVPQTDATLSMLVKQITAAFQAFVDQLKQSIGQIQKPAPPPTPTGGTTPVPVPQEAPPVSLPPTTKPSGVGVALGVVGIALVALGTGALIMTFARQRKAAR
jgi:hypothetical protein